MRCRSGQDWEEAFGAPAAVLDFDGSKRRSPALVTDCQPMLVLMPR
jgi:hypothetical protein